MLTGTIGICDPEFKPARVRDLLRSIGVRVGGWNAHTCEFINCRVTNETMSRLDRWWGPLIWTLTPEATT